MLDQIDVVIPVASKDIPKLRSCIEGVLKNSLNPIRTIYVITQRDSERPDFHQPSVVWVDESKYPFTKNEIDLFFEAKGSPYKNSSWYYQQLLKLYIFRVISDLLPNTLILDSDYTFTKPITFLDSHGQALLASGYPFQWLLNVREYPYPPEHIHIDFAKRLIPEWFPVDSFTGIQHHILLQKDIVEDLFRVVESAHKREFWEAFVDQVELQKWNAASEFVIYYHFARQRYPDRVATRHLKACDLIYDSQENDGCFLNLQNQLAATSDFYAVGCHGFLDLANRLKTIEYISSDLKNKILALGSMYFKLILNEGMLQIETVDVSRN